MIPYLLLIFSFLFLSFCSASDLSHPLLMSELIDIALENHPSTRQTWWNAHRAASAVGSAKSAYYPYIGLEAKAVNGRDFKSINGPDVEYTIVGADVTLDMLLVDFGERKANVNAAKAALLAANWQVDWNIQKVIIGVLENAYSTLLAQEIVEVNALSLADAEDMTKVAKELNRVGLTSIADVYASQAVLSQMRMNFSQKKAHFDIQKGKLAASLGLAPNKQTELAPLAQIPLPPKEKVNALISLASNQRSDLLEKQAKLTESIHLLSKVKASYKPKVFLSGRGGVNHAFHDREQGGQYQIALHLEMPLFDGFDSIYQKRIACDNIRISQEELAELQLSIALEVFTYLRSFEAAEEILPEAEVNLENSIKAYEAMLEKYKAGKERITEVSITLQQLALARTSYLEVKTQWLVAIANLAYATGTINLCREGK